tara:strand:- start:1080 stop:1295 length:216 start_codon:yes stop_codon:yes gene_type:complete
MTDDRKVHFNVREIYGVERIYPACENAKLFLKMTGRKCLTRQDLGRIVELGFRVIQVSSREYRFEKETSNA